MILLNKPRSLVGGYQHFEVNQLPPSSCQYYAKDVCSFLREVGNHNTWSHNMENMLLLSFRFLLAPFVFMFILSGCSFFMYFVFYRYATNTIPEALVA